MRASIAGLAWEQAHGVQEWRLYDRAFDDSDQDSVAWNACDPSRKEEGQAGGFDGIRQAVTEVQACLVPSREVISHLQVVFAHFKLAIQQLIKRQVVPNWDSSSIKLC
ncbi:hypothetical protein HRR83_005230 [Exophiala dermatitidis]|uniref:Uncharacterized protein n=1 Tax=Exophiala dermatitidis TaxID=5970 RepID=A0AAN6EUW4_EXODE|nr:hypothetical protein HRR74_005082 [Exophiala dermatitidis]KAJ4518669.1 hypothetical protein HRR73_004250 [Exophiala dermatitidis]KAJ4534182.1 hypothetical protein HRR76_006116 [Exophiala dermatitidis]KAJ4550336.1 hypothetical protein HRR77_003803 [Exophiala dermatitidis]KAJ4563463.1 hypothetical protein HRR79_006343 [Exophiala dermatitidis]